MTDSDRLLSELNFLGVDETTVEVLALLPLIQVAWADGEVQDKEREMITEIARDQYHLKADAQAVLANWLEHAPTEQYLTRGRKALLALAHARDDFDLNAASLDDVVEFSKEIAKAAGGFMGFRSVSIDEQMALEDIAAALSVSGSAVMADLYEDDEDVEDENTDVLDPGEMAKIREAAHIAEADTRELASEAVADLIHHGHDGGARFEMDASGLTIGRSRANDVQIPHDAMMSRVHARIVVEGDRFYAEDNGTTNGTLVNGERVTKRRLYGGEQVRVGTADFTFLVR